VGLKVEGITKSKKAKLRTVRNQLTWLVDRLDRSGITDVIQGVGALGGITDGYYMLYPKANASTGKSIPHFLCGCLLSIHSI
jgi:hypothetical protein